MSNLLGGKQGTAYLGTNANQPPNWVFCERNPQTFDIDYSLGDVWLNTTTQEKWVLVSLANPGGATPKGAFATWVPWGAAGAGLLTLTCPTGGPIAVHGNPTNITLVTNIPNLTITGADAPASTITFDVVGLNKNLVTNLIDHAGVAVTPDPLTGGINMITNIPLL